MSLQIIQRLEDGGEKEISPNWSIYMMEKDINLSERILNDILGDITPRESVKVMGRTFSDALPTLLARRGAKSAQLQMLGTWSKMAVRRYMPRAVITFVYIL